MSILDRIHSPADLKPMTRDELRAVSEELRVRLIEVCSRTGGHIGAGLGVVELSVALHAIFDTPRDKIVWDVGHQGYPHKFLTGRADRFETLRQENGLSGFLKRTESEYDTFGAGHAGTAISAGYGMAVARDLNGEQFKVVSILGDGALTCGLAYEGLNNSGASERDFIVILNDNEMSIAPNVGAMSKYLTSIQRNPLYNRLRSAVGSVIDAAPGPLAGVGPLVRMWESFPHPGCAFRGARLPVFRSDRRPRHRCAHGHLRRSEGHERSAPHSLHYAEREGIPGRRAHREMARSSARPRPSDWEAAQGLDCEFGVYGRVWARLG